MERTRQFTLMWVFCMVSITAMLAAMVGFALRPQPHRVPEATLLEATDQVQAGMQFREVCECLGMEPSTDWLGDSAGGFALWRFEVTDVTYSDSRASFFVKFHEGVVEDSFLLYPLESAGGGMVF